MIEEKILLATALAAYLYVVAPGPAFLALFSLAAAKGRRSGAWFICGHLVGDVTWGGLAVAAIDLTADQHARIEAVARPAPIYPLWHRARTSIDRAGPVETEYLRGYRKTLGLD